MSRYAEGTEVGVEKSVAEMRGLLERAVTDVTGIWGPSAERFREWARETDRCATPELTRQLLNLRREIDRVIGETA